MDVPFRQTEEQETRRVSAEEILRVYEQIAQTCCYAGLKRQDAEDVAQEIWTWLLQGGDLVLAQRAPWMSAVTRNFILRYWRRRYRQNFREGMSLDTSREPEASPGAPEVERAELLDRMAANLPRTEAKLLVLIRRGYTFVEAADALGIPRGSRAYFKDRLVECGRREIRRRRLADFDVR